jgi:hypothetical protein
MVDAGAFAKKATPTPTPVVAITPTPCPSPRLTSASSVETTPTTSLALVSVSPYTTTVDVPGNLQTPGHTETKHLIALTFVFKNTTDTTIAVDNFTQVSHSSGNYQVDGGAIQSTIASYGSGSDNVPDQLSPHQAVTLKFDIPDGNKVTFDFGLADLSHTTCSMSGWQIKP